MNQPVAEQGSHDDETYERVRTKIAGLSSARRRDERALEWVDSGCLAVARDETGARCEELAVRGDE